MSAEFVINSEILQPGRLADVLNPVMAESLSELKEIVRNHQITQRHTGKSVKIGSVIHRQSAVGESPSPLSFALVNSTETEQFSPTRGEVRVTRFYGAILQEKRGRDVTITPEKIFKDKFTEKISRAVKELI